LEEGKPIEYGKYYHKVSFKTTDFMMVVKEVVVIIFNLLFS